MKLAVVVLLLCVGIEFAAALAASENYTCNSDRPPEARRTLKLLTMLPFPNPDPQFDPSWNEGPKVLPAVYLAAEQVNNRTDLLPCHRLEIVSVDGGCDIDSTTAVSATEGLVGEDRNETIIGVIGPGCSRSTLQAASLVNQPSIQLVHIHTGGSPLLGDRTLYKNSLGILGSSQTYVDLSLALMGKSGWSNIAILFESNRVFFRTTKEAFVASLNSSIDVKFISPVYPTFYPLDGVRTSLARIVFVLTSIPNSMKIMCLAYHMGMVYPAYQWVILGARLRDFVSPNASLSDVLSFFYDGQTYQCSLNEILTISLEGTFLLNYRQITLRLDNNKLANISYEEYLDLYERYAENSGVSTTNWANYFYDAVWAWARTLHNLTKGDEEIFDNVRYGNRTLANMILDEFYSPDFAFEGMTGLVSFNSSNGFTDRPSNLYQVVDGIERHVAYNNGSNNIVKLQSLVIVPDLVRSVSGVHIALIPIFATIQFVEFFTIVILHFLTVVYRKEKSVRASSPTLSHFAFVGTYVLLFGLSLNIFVDVKVHPDEVNGNVCQATWGWIFPIGFTLTIGTVTVRTWRLYRIFTHYLNPGKFISNTALITMVVILLCIDLLLAIVWTAVDPLRIVVTEHTVRVGSANELYLDRSCRSQYGVAGFTSWLVIIMSIRISLLVVMVMLSLLTRRIPNKNFATSSLRVFSYIFSAVFFIGFAIYYLFVYLNLDPNFDHAVLFTMLNFLIVMYTACIFIPPLAPVIHQKVQSFRSNRSWLTAPHSNNISLTEDNALSLERSRRASRDKLL